MSVFDEMLQSKLSLGEQKRQRLEESTNRKKRALEPAWENLAPENYRVLDGDTIELLDSGRRLRLSGLTGESIDTFESDSSVYEDFPDRLAAHKKAYADMTGKAPWTVTTDQLVDYGKVQKRRLEEYLKAKTAEKQIQFQPQGVDATGKRVVANMRSLRPDGVPEAADFFSELSSRDANANYSSDYNRLRRFNDLLSGEEARHMSGAGPRPWRKTLTDQGTNLVSGGAQMLNSTAQAVNTLMGLNTAGADSFFSKNRDRIEAFKQRNISPQQARRERMAAKQAAMQPELYEMRKQEHMANGASEAEANFRAGTEEFVDSTRNLIQNPGRILDAAVESLPYMIGVGAAGRVAVNAAVKGLEKKVLAGTTRKLAGKTVSDAQIAAVNKLRVQKFLSSKTGKAYMNTVATTTGISTVALSEGLSNSADVYDSIVSMSEEEAMQSEKYQALRFDRGMSHREALEELGETAFRGTLGKGIAIAGAAAALTGAGAFEARLFTGKAGTGSAREFLGIGAKEGAATAAQGAKEGAKGGILRATGRKAAQYAKFAGPAGAKEATEELIQSGGGEFLSQLETFQEGLGPEPGPGIGAAAAEGALVGLASGVGAQTVSGGLKNIANLNPNSSGFKEYVNKIRTQVSGNTQTVLNTTSGRADSSVSRVVNQQKAQAQGKTPPASEASVNAALETASRQQEAGEFTFLDYQDLEDTVNRRGVDNLTEDQQQQWGIVRDAVMRELNDFVGGVVKSGRKFSELNKGEKFLVLQGINRNVPALKDVDPDSQFGKVRQHIQAVDKAINELDANSGELRGLGLAARVQEGKLEDVVRKNPKDPDYPFLGLKAYKRVLLEAIANDDKEAFDDYARRFNYFLKSQRTKLQDLYDGLSDPENRVEGARVGSFTYEPGKTERLYQRLKQEQVLMESVADELRNAWNQWTGKEAPKQERAAPPPDVAAPVSPEAAQAAAQTETAQPKAPVSEQRRKNLQARLDKLREQYEGAGTLAYQRGRLREAIKIMEELDDPGLDTAKAELERMNAQLAGTKPSRKKRTTKKKPSISKTEAKTQLKEIRSQLEALGNQEDNLENQEARLKLLGEAIKIADKGGLEEISLRTKKTYTDTQNRVSALKREARTAGKQAAKATTKAQTRRDKLTRRLTTLENSQLNLERLIENESYGTAEELASLRKKLRNVLDQRKKVEAELENLNAQETTGQTQATDNTGAEARTEPKAGSTISAHKNLGKKKHAQLVKIAQEAGIEVSKTGYMAGKRLNKNQLIDLILNATMSEESRRQAEEDARILEQAQEDTTGEETTVNPVIAATKNIVQTKDTATILSFLTQQGHTRVYRGLAKRLRDVLGRRQVNVAIAKDQADFNRLMGKETRGFAGYNRNTKTVIFRQEYLESPLMQEGILHEYVHAALDGFLRDNPDHPLVRELAKIRASVVKWLDENAQEELADPKSFESKARDLLISQDQEEILTWTLTDPRMQALMRKVPVEADNAFTSFVNWVKKVLGLADTEALTQLFNVADQLFLEIQKDAVDLSRKELEKEISNLRRELDYIYNNETFDSFTEEVSNRATEIENRLRVLYDQLNNNTEDAAEARAQAEAQPERSAGAEAAAIRVNEANRRNRDEVEAILRLIDKDRAFAEELAESGVHVSDPELSRWINDEIRAGVPISGVLAQALASHKATQVDPTIPTETVEEVENLDDIINVAKSLYQGKGDSAAWHPADHASPIVTDERLEKLAKIKQAKVTQGELNTNLASVKQKLRDVIAAMGLPFSLKQGFEQRSKNFKSLFTLIPNLHQVLANPTARETLYNELNLSSKERAAFNAFADFRREFAYYAQGALAELPNASYVDEWLRDNPAYLLTDSFDKLDPNVVSIMAYEAMNWLTGAGLTTFFNDIDAIRDMLGWPQDQRIPNSVLNILGQAGTLRRNVIEDLGKGIWQHLNIKVAADPDLDLTLTDRMQMALGSMALRTLVASGRAHEIPIDAEWYNNLKSEDGRATEEGKQINFVRIGTQPDIDDGGPSWLHQERNLTLREATLDGRKAMDTLLGQSASTREPLLDKPGPERVPKRALRSATVLGKRIRDAIGKANEMEYRSNAQLIDLIKRFPSLEQYAELAHEYNRDLDTVHETEAKAIEGRNAAYLKMLRDGISFSDRVKGAGFYFTWQMIKTGRFIMAQNTVNPQNNKVHRFMFSQTAWENTVKATGRSRALENFKIAVALGMGIKVDRQSIGTSLEQLESLMQSDVVVNALNVLNKSEEQLEDGKFSQEDLDALAPLLAKEGTHTLAALEAWNKYLAAKAVKGSFTTSLPMEVDGVTNGFAAGLLQTPPTNPTERQKYIRQLIATGVIPHGITADNYAQWKEDPNNLDNYEENSRLVAHTLQNMYDADGTMRQTVSADDKKGTVKWKVATNALYDMAYRIKDGIAGGFHTLGLQLTAAELRELGNKKARDFSKNPLTITSYLASPNTVARSLVEGIVEKFYAQLAAFNAPEYDFRVADNATDAEKEAARVKAREVYGLVADHLNKAMRTANSWIYAQNQGRAAVGQAQEPYLKIEGKEQYWTAELLRDFIMVEGRKEDSKYKGDLREFVRKYEMDSSDELQHFRRAMYATYGVAMKEAIEIQVGDMTEVRNTLVQALSLMNALYAVDMRRRLNTEATRRNKNLGPLQVRQLEEQMHKEGLVPAIFMPQSDRTKPEEALVLTKYETQVVKNSRIKTRYNKQDGVTRLVWDKKGQASIVVEQGNGVGSTTSQLVVHLPTADVGVAGLVSAIHMLDGFNNMLLWEKHPVLNLHDATAHNFNDSDVIGYEGNQGYYQMHATYSIAQEVFNSASRMFRLFNIGDGRLSVPEQVTAAQMFMDVLRKHNQINERVYDRWYKKDPVGWIRGPFFEKFRGSVESITEARRELFEAPDDDGNTFIARVSQFSKDSRRNKATYVVTERERPATQPTVYDLIERAKNENSALHVNATANEIIENAQDGNVDKAVRLWLGENSPTPAGAMRVLVTILRKIKSPAAATMMQVQSMLAPHMDGLPPIIVGPTSDETAHGETIGNQVTINGGRIEADGGSTLGTTFHEIIHVALGDRISWLQKNDPASLQFIVDSALGRLKEIKSKGSKASVAERGLYNELARQVTSKDKARFAEEYLVWLLSQDQGSQVFQLAFNQSLQNVALRGLATAFTRGNRTRLVLRNSQHRIDDSLFHNVDHNLLESDKLQETFASLNAMSLTDEDPEHAAFLNQYVEDVLVPGLQGIDPLYAAFQVKTGANYNLGDIAFEDDKNVLRIQAAGNKLTNNADMSLQETFTHEVTHAVVHTAFKRDRRLYAEARRIFEAVKDRITWRSFMPENPGADPAAAEAVAKARYDYIFSEGNPNYLDEFIAIGRTNKAFATALSKLDVPLATKPIWDGSILSSIMNLVERAFAWLRAEALNTRRSADANEALKNLTEKMVVLNLQHKQRVMETANRVLLRNRADQALVSHVQEQLDKLQATLRRTGPVETGGVANMLRQGLHGALAMRTEGTKKAMREFHRYIGATKNNDLSRLFAEVLPYNQDDMYSPSGQSGFLDLFRQSKVVIDIARQRAIEHARSSLRDGFDPKVNITKPQRLALTKAVIRTDLVSLVDPNTSVGMDYLANLLRDDQFVGSEIARYEALLQAELRKQGASGVYEMYRNQIDSLSTYMTTGTMSQYNGMKNAHNIVKQFNLHWAQDRIPIKDADALIPLVDKLATLRAVGKTSRAVKNSALEVIDHEMGRTDDNGFMVLLGMHRDFQDMALNDLFRGIPTLMEKGYVYDITDPDVNIEAIVETPENLKKMKDLGMVRIGTLPQDLHDGSRQKVSMALYKGVRGPASWLKGAVSMTDLHRRGTNLWEINQYNPKVSGPILGKMRTDTHKSALQQFKANNVVPDLAIAIPVLDENGNIVDYSYQMSHSNKEQHLKNSRNNDYFESVIPRMFGSIVDRVESPKINADVVDLLDEEFTALENSPEHKFVMIGRYATKPNGKPDLRAREMYQLLPDDMKKRLHEKFGERFGEAFPIRDDVVNLVLGYRKLSVVDAEVDGKKVVKGKATFAVKTAEKIWQEIIQLVRVKMALVNPQVVAGNMASNFGILLADGIDERYIKAKTSEAIRSMRMYQKDVRNYDKLARKIGIYKTHGKPIDSLQRELNRLKAEITNNPVSKLVKEGLFTSIVEDSTSQEDTYREWIIGGAVDRFTSGVPRSLVNMAKEAYMIPGTNSFNMAIAATQYGDFIGRYVKFKYDTEVRKKDEKTAIYDALAYFIYYDMPLNRTSQMLADNGVLMFPKFFLRIQHVVARLFSENPIKATSVFMAQSALGAPFSENIGSYGLFNGAPYRFEPLPYRHLDKLDPTDGGTLWHWFLFPFGLWGRD